MRGAFIFAALKVAITLSVIGAVVAEFVAAERGLGDLILFSTSSFKVPLAFAALALLVVSSLLLYRSIVWLQQRFFPGASPPRREGPRLAYASQRFFNPDRKSTR